MASGVPGKRDFSARTLSDCLLQAGLDPAAYSPHLSRAGWATDLVAAGYPDLKIQAAGRWASNAYMNYVRFDGLEPPPPSFPEDCLTSRVLEGKGGGVAFPVFFVFVWGDYEAFRCLVFWRKLRLSPQVLFLPPV